MVSHPLRMRKALGSNPSVSKLVEVEGGRGRRKMENVEERGERGRERKEKGWEKKKGEEKKKEKKKKRGGGMRQAPNVVSLPSHPRTGACVSMRCIAGNVGQWRQCTAQRTVQSLT